MITIAICEKVLPLQHIFEVKDDALVDKGRILISEITIPEDKKDDGALKPIKESKDFRPF